MEHLSSSTLLRNFHPFHLGHYLLVAVSSHLTAAGPFALPA